MKNRLARALIALAFAGNTAACAHEQRRVDTPTPSTPSQPPTVETKNEKPATNQFWWPDQLDLTPLRSHSTESNALGEDFDYAKEFATLDLNAVKDDIKKVMTTSQPWWPADYGNYGPFFIRMAWHSAGTYRQGDGRGGASGGQQRFEPLNSWPDNANLDKARRLLWPVKEKYGQKISWGDLMVLTGTVALEQMGVKPYGFAGGRRDDWEPDVVYWGPEKKWLADQRYSGNHELQKPLSAVQMGLIYVNPEGPNGNPDPQKSATDIRETFGRMGMNDEETVALIVGGHAFGKAHGAHDPGKCLGPAPAGGPIDQQGLGWKNNCGTGSGGDTVTSGLEGAWSVTPTAWSNSYLTNLYAYDWEQTKSPAGATQWQPKNGAAANLVPDAHDPSKRHPPMMFTSDLALKVDPAYGAITTRWKDHPDELQAAFAKAWFKLTHRDMGPKARYLGPDVPKDDLIWQDPLPKADKSTVIDAANVTELKTKILAAGIAGPDLIRTAWASAVTFRGTDMRGGANGARIRLAPEKDWAVNNPQQLGAILGKLTTIQTDFNKSHGKKVVSLADVIVLGGTAAVEQAAKSAGSTVKVDFTPGRVDAAQEQTDPKGFAVLEPTADGFRNYYAPGTSKSPTEALVDKASQLDLTVPEMTVLVGGLRALNTNANGSNYGVFTTKPGQLTNDFFVNLLDMGTVWSKTGTDGIYEGKDRATGAVKWTATPVDLIFGSSSELRAVSEVYAEVDGKDKFAQDFVNAWTKVMNLDRFDVQAELAEKRADKAEKAVPKTATPKKVVGDKKGT